MRKLSVLLTVVILVTMVSTVSAAQTPLPKIGVQGGEAVQNPGVEYIHGSLWTNGTWDHQAMMEANWVSPTYSYAWTIDDFVLGRAKSPYVLTEIRAVLVTTDDDPIAPAWFQVWSDCGDPADWKLCNDGPSLTLKTEGYSTTRYKIGYWQPPCCPGETYNVFEYHFYPDDMAGGPFILGAGRYWLKVWGVADDEDQRFFWASSGNGIVQGYMGYFQSDHYQFYCPGWYNSLYVMDYATDFAFDIDGYPVAGPRLSVLDVTHYTKPRLFPPSWEVHTSATIVKDLTKKGIPGADVYGCLYNPDGTLVGCAWKSTNSSGVASWTWSVYQDGIAHFCIGKEIWEAWRTPYDVQKSGCPYCQDWSYNYVNNHCYDPCSETTCIAWDLSCDCDGGNACWVPDP